MRAQPPPLRSILAQLIAAPSVSCVNPELDQSNEGVATLLAEWLEDLGFDIVLQSVSERPKKVNLIATLGRGDDGLVLAGHTDTVPYDATRWQTDPFELTEKGGRLYGLGTADMKGFLGIAVEAVRELRASALQRPVCILATADEETGMDGARKLAEAGLAPGRYALIGEPTGMRPVRMHKGIIMEAVQIVGSSGHSSDPSLGLNAIEGMHRAVAEILRWRADLQARHIHRAFAYPVPSLNLGRIHGGDNPNRICPECELQFDLRQLPGMDIAALRADIAQRIEAALADTGFSVRWRSLFPGIPAFETPPDGTLVQALEALTGQAAGAVAFGTEGPFFARLGMETVIFGPGDVACAHQPDEFLPMDRIDPTVGLLRGLIRRICL
jgi:acetylornithine deacetylase